MARQEAQYRGYKISREYRLGQWQLGVEPSQSDLPIMCKRYFITEAEKRCTLPDTGGLLDGQEAWREAMANFFDALAPRRGMPKEL